ncbi:hypothetical protein PG994_013421 [Apiospora phragmitis]|uniref:BTB domain-containing protein n=1 Tax=Apiospora phragmitis TaxID=2905665 RepID=A0ABR1T8P3_9PEZI
MALPFDIILRSRPITFVIGPNKTEYTVQAYALTRLSSPLRVLLDGGMKEANEGRVVWDDVDDHIFVHFIQWAYTDDYVPAEPYTMPDATSVQLHASPTSESPQSEKVFYSLQEKPLEAPAEHRTSTSRSNYYATDGSSPFCSSCCNYLQGCLRGCASLVDEHKLKSRVTRKGPAMVKDFVTSTDWAMHDTSFKPRLNKNPCEDYTIVFFCHASLYIIADKYDIGALSKLSMHRLHATLKAFTLYPSRMSDILSLAAFVFENTRDGDPIRLMIVHYCACIVEDLAKSEDYEPTLQNYPQFSSALMVKMSERLD